MGACDRHSSILVGWDGGSCGVGGWGQENSSYDSNSWAELVLRAGVASMVTLFGYQYPMKVSEEEHKANGVHVPPRRW